MKPVQPPEPAPNTHGITFFPSQRFVGGYTLGASRYGTVFVLERRPSWLHRFLMRHLLGWFWKDTL